MAVRNGPDASGATGPAEGSDDGEGAAKKSAPGTADRSPGSRGQAADPPRIDDIVDVRRLADRLSREFERKARIERERRGR